MKRILKQNERIKKEEGSEQSHVVLYSDDYDNLENSAFNTKVCMLTFWEGFLYFPGGVLLDRETSFEENIFFYLKAQLDFNISDRKNDMIHLSSIYYEEEKTAIHTYALKIEKSQMANLKLIEVKLKENGDPEEGYEIALDNCGLNKLNVSLKTIPTLMKSNFGLSVQDSFTLFVDKYLSNKIQEEKDLFEKIRLNNEKRYVLDYVEKNATSAKEELRVLLKQKGLDFLLEPNDPRIKNMLDEKGEFKDEALNKLFLSEDSILSEISSPKKDVVKKKSSLDFSQKGW